jgi:uncharacterized lipoprotein YddW (UPF0748 family)
MLNVRRWVPKFALLIALGITLAVAVPLLIKQPAFARLPSAELRGVWLTNIDSDVLFSRDRLTHALQRLARLNFNTVYPTVWNWGYTLYPSAVAEPIVGRSHSVSAGESLDPAPGLQERDVLAEIIEQGHQQGLSVIPWFEFGFMAPADSELAHRHPNWLTHRQDGNQIWQEGQHERVWLNPFHPQVQQFIVNLITEIVANYDVNGIQLDDHFGLPFDFGYDSLTVQLYQQEHKGQRPPDDPSNPEWMRWRASKLTDLMTQVFRAVKARKPDCLVALSPNPHPFSYENFLQDWPTWEQRGLIEELVLQVYRTHSSNFVMELARPEIAAARRHIPVGVGILTGLKHRSVPIEQIQLQTQVVRERQLAGVSFFFYETLWNSATETQAEREAAFQSLFSTRVPRPRVLGASQ